MNSFLNGRWILQTGYVQPALSEVISFGVGSKIFAASFQLKKLVQNY